MGVKELDELKGEIEKLRDDLAGMTAFFEKAEKQNQHIIEEENPKKAIRIAKEELHNIRYGAKEGVDAFSDEKEIMETLEDLEKILPENLKKESEEIKSKLEVVKSELAKLASRIAGEVRDSLNQIIRDEQLIAAWEKRNPENVPHAKDKLKQDVAEEDKRLHDLLTWISTGQAILRVLEAFESKLEELS